MAGESQLKVTGPSCHLGLRQQRIKDDHVTPMSEKLGVKHEKGKRGKMAPNQTLPGVRKPVLHLTLSYLEIRQSDDRGLFQLGG